MFCYYNDGFTSKTVSPDYIPAPGEVIFDHPASDEELAANFPNYAAIKDDMSNPVKTKQEKLNELFAAYGSEINQLGVDWSVAKLQIEAGLGDQEVLDSIKQEMANKIDQFDIDYAAIINEDEGGE